VEQHALNLLSLVILNFGGAQREDVELPMTHELLMTHVLQSPDELYNENRPFNLLSALKKGGFKDVLSRRLHEERTGVDKAAIKNRIKELLERLQLRE
jgi:hypothetical protein